MAAVILSYNHENLTRRCIDSVLKYFSQSSIYLVHNGTQEKIVHDFRKSYKDVHHLYIKVNRGFTGGINKGLEEIFNKNIQNVLFLTNDTQIEQLDVQALQSLNESPFLLAPKIFRRQTSNIDSMGGICNLQTGTLQHLQGPAENLKKFERFYVPGTAFFINKTAWSTTGPFDESLGTYWEDVDYSLRAAKKSVQLGVIPAVVLLHGIGKTCHKDPRYTIFHYHRNRRVVVWRHGGPRDRIKFAPRYLVHMTRKLFKFAYHGDEKRLKLTLKALVSW